jgi:hypothetical protein
MKKYILNPKVVRGGKAIPLGNNFYYMQGRKHEQGGIDLGADDKNGLEVEGGEVVHTSKNSIKVFSAVPMLNGKSPAEKIINGENANKVFKEQEEFKDRNNYNDDGSKKYQNGGKKLLFTSLKTTNDRGYEVNNLNYIYNKLKSSGLYNDKQIAAILANIVEESGANPYAIRTDKETGKQYKDTGLLQWIDRYPGIDKKRLAIEELDNQINYINKTLRDTTDIVSWTHGGEGSGYMKAVDAYNEFANSNDLERINYALTLGYVRPKGRKESAANRYKVAQQIYDEINNNNKLNNYIEKQSVNTDYNPNENPILRSSFFELGGDKDNPNINYIYDRINKKNTPDFIRMRNPNRKFIKDWQNPNYIATNKVAIGTDENGQVFLYNEVQDDGKGGLIDMTNPVNKQSDFDGMNRAIERRDTIHINSIEDGLKFSNEYKSKFPGFKRMGGQVKKNIFVELNVGGKKKLVPASSFTGERQKALLGKEDDNINYIETPKYKNILDTIVSESPKSDLSKRIIEDKKISTYLKNGIMPPMKKLNSVGVPRRNPNNSKFINAAGHFNEITLGDIIGGVTNTIGSITNYNSNRRTLNNMKYSSAPLPIQAKKLKTRFNINPQLDKIREYLKATNRDIDANTASSRVALARKGIARTNALLQTNNLYATKENAETQLLNQDNMNQQNVAARNVEMYNRWREGKSNFDNMLLEKHAENTSDLIRGLTTTVQNIIGGIEQRKNINNTLSTIAAANPNVTAEILKDLGVDFSYLIRNGKRIKNKKN